MNKRYVRWLDGELPALVSRGILTDRNADEIRQYYQAAPGQAAWRTGLLVCGILGAVLIGLGIILLLAHNWYLLSRAARTVLALAPLLAAQFLAAWVLLRRADSTAWREGIATFLMLMVAASMALVHQTYHIPADTGEFTLAWMLLSIPLVYLFQATLPALLYLIGIAVWALNRPHPNEQALYLWLLAALVIPYLLQLHKKNPHANRLATLNWAAALWLAACGLPLTFAATSGDAWILVYSGLFAVMYLTGSLSAGDEPRARHWPWIGLGAAGTIFLSYLLTFRGVLDLTHTAVYLAWSERLTLNAIPYYVLLVGLPLLAVGLLLVCLRRGRRALILYGLAPLFAFACYFLSWLGNLPSMLLGNAYFFALAGVTLWAGIRRERLGLLNLGLLMLAALIAARFFDSSLGFTARAITFILIGLGFLGANLFVLRRRKGGRR